MKTCSIPGLSGWSNGLVSTCSGTSLQPTRGISSQWFNTVKARCSSVCFFKPTKRQQIHQWNTILTRYWNHTLLFPTYGKICVWLSHVWRKTKSWKREINTIFILDFSRCHEDPVLHLHSSCRAVMRTIQFSFLAQFSQDVCGFQWVSPNIVAMATEKTKS